MVGHTYVDRIRVEIRRIKDNWSDSRASNVNSMITEWIILVTSIDLIVCGLITDFFYISSLESYIKLHIRYANRRFVDGQDITLHNF